MSTATSDTPTEETNLKEIGPGFLWKRETVVELPDGRTALLRLANQFQHAEIRQAALAAKARRMRQLRDENTDAFVVLEDEMDALARLGDQMVLVEELVGREWWKDQLAAEADVAEEEDYEHISRDRQRLEVLGEMDPVERDEDEWKELQTHVENFFKAVQERLTERQRPRREALEALDINALVDLVRQERIAQEGNVTFNLHFSLWQMYSGSYELKGYETRTVKGNTIEAPMPGKPLFSSVDDVRRADPNLLDALAHAYNELEASYSEALQGNS